MYNIYKQNGILKKQNKNWVEINDDVLGPLTRKSQIKLKTILQSIFLNYSDVQILNKGIIAAATNTDIAPDRSNK